MHEWSNVVKIFTLIGFWILAWQAGLDVYNTCDLIRWVYMCTHGEIIQARKQKGNDRNSAVLKYLWDCISFYKNLLICFDALKQQEKKYLYLFIPVIVKGSIGERPGLYGSIRFSKSFLIMASQYNICPHSAIRLRQYSNKEFCILTPRPIVSHLQKSGCCHGWTKIK